MLNKRIIFTKIARYIDFHDNLCSYSDEKYMSGRQKRLFGSDPRHIFEYGIYK